MSGMTEKEREYVNWLYHIKGFGRKKMGVILSQGISAEDIYCMPKRQIKAFLQECCGYSEKQAVSSILYMEEFGKEKTPEKLAEEMRKKEILFLLPGDPEYPEKLACIPDEPFALYMKGDRKRALELSKRSVAVIGARECSEYGRFTAEYIGKNCAYLGLPVVSGMAYGIDGIAQWAAAEEGAVVGAVLGCGVDICYPYSNRKLYDFLLKEGCVFSEYVPGTEPKPTNFPPRNRIISGISDAVVVVEAKEKSGTLITVDMALEQGKDVYVVPGRITDPLSKGCNRLIRQGAAIVCDVKEMLEEIAKADLHSAKGKPQERGEAENPYAPEELRYSIYKALDMQPKSVQQIFDSHVWERGEVEKPDVKQLQTELFYMRMQGNVIEKNGRFCLNV